MTHHPFDPSELDRLDPDLEATAERLERYASDLDAAPPADLAARIVSAIDEEPVPSAWWTSLTAGLVAWRRPAAVLASVAIVVAIVMTAVVVGDLFERMRNVGASPEPAMTVSPTPSASPSPSPTATPSPTSAPSSSLDTPDPTPTSSPSRPGTTPSPTDDDDDTETPEPSDDPDDDDGDNSGPGSSGD